MATPITALAGAYETRKVVMGESGVEVSVLPLVVGLIASLVAWFAAIAILLRFLRSHPTHVFAIWNTSKQELFIARDRMGKKPLLYADVNGQLVFGSEFSALLLHPDISRDINPEALDYYLAFMCIPAPVTAYRAMYADLARKYDAVFYPYFLWGVVDGTGPDRRLTLPDGMHPTREGVAPAGLPCCARLGRLLATAAVATSTATTLVFSMMCSFS